MFSQFNNHKLFAESKLGMAIIVIRKICKVSYNNTKTHLKLVQALQSSENFTY